MTMLGFLEQYFSDFTSTLDQFLAEGDNGAQLNLVVRLLERTKTTGATIYLVGNGGSAAIAETYGD